MRTNEHQIYSDVEVLVTRPQAIINGLTHRPVGAGRIRVNSRRFVAQTQSSDLPASALRTALRTFLSGGKKMRPFLAATLSPTSTVNSPRPPSRSSALSPSSRSNRAATRTALVLYDAQVLQ